MLMLQYFPSAHHENRANNGALMKISRENAVAQTAAWIAINFPFCWHEEKNEHCLHVWLLHKSSLVFFFFFIWQNYIWKETQTDKQELLEEWDSLYFLSFHSAMSYPLSTPGFPDLILISFDCTAVHLKHKWAWVHLIGLIEYCLLLSSSSCGSSVLLRLRAAPVCASWCFHYTTTCVKHLVLPAGIRTKSRCLFLLHFMFISMFFPVTFMLVLFSAGEVKNNVHCFGLLQVFSSEI